MPSISNDGGPIDYVAFFTKQLPLDLARMAALRDELEKRQGAMMAVDEINAAKAAADAALEQARAEAAAMTASAKETLERAKAREAAVAKKEKAQADREAAFTVEMDARAAEIAKQDGEVAKKIAYIERDLAERSAELNTLAARLEDDRRALDIRIQNFQAKVAALSV